jgi:hypothetical protein
MPTCAPTDDNATAAGSPAWRTVRGTSASRLGDCSDCATAITTPTP